MGDHFLPPYEGLLYEPPSLCRVGVQIAGPACISISLFPEFPPSLPKGCPPVRAPACYLRQTPTAIAIPAAAVDAASDAAPTKQ